MGSNLEFFEWTPSRRAASVCEGVAMTAESVLMGVRLS